MFGIVLHVQQTIPKYLDQFLR
ncbi:hypothetical protein CY0110_16392 [Crocosphaera chwakensis CCY0110]|uniref:Uncharacterized protein n=1 Tax=Crocosphaera chwakensis CCY0110 TaxID=391612 RepID=A3IHW0_9CHRO|nr:hypothetical protein CY0110_16392 [Crocosphaera chwakensis CCY0110]